MRKTFTVLVTLNLDRDQNPDHSRISEIVQCAMEEGTSCSGSFLAAQVDTFEGRVIVGGGQTLRPKDIERLTRFLSLHVED